MTTVKKLTLGLGSRLNSGQAGEDRDGLIYVDEIRLCPQGALSKPPVLLVLSRDPEGKQHDGFFFTAEQVIGGPAGRWSIEDTFTNTRQAVRGREPIAVIPLALAAYRAVRLRG